MFQNQPHAKLEEECLHTFTSSMLAEQLSEVQSSIIILSHFCYVLQHSISLFGPCLITRAGHFLGVTASWIVQVAIDIYRFLSRTLNSKEDDEVDAAEQAKLLGKKVTATTVRCGASLVFASIGAGIGATLFRPSAGQWIGKYFFLNLSFLSLFFQSLTLVKICVFLQAVPWGTWQGLLL